MELKNSIKAAIRAMLHPSMNVKTMNIGNALKFYYRVSLIPLILAVIVNLAVFLIFGYSQFMNFGLTMPVAHALSTFGFAFAIFKAIGYPILYLLALVPLSLLLNAGVYQLFSKFLFDLVKRDYHRTLTAYVYAEMPCVLLFWLFNIPIAGFIILMIAAIWSVIVLVISLAKQQGINVRQAVGTWLLSVTMVMLVVMLVVFAIVFSLIGIFGGLTALHPGMLPPGFFGIYNASMP